MTQNWSCPSPKITRDSNERGLLLPPPCMLGWHPTSLQWQRASKNGLSLLCSPVHSPITTSEARCGKGCRRGWPWIESQSQEWTRAGWRLIQVTKASPLHCHQGYWKPRSLAVRSTNQNVPPQPQATVKLEVPKRRLRFLHSTMQVCSRTHDYPTTQRLGRRVQPQQTHWVLSTTEWKDNHRNERVLILLGWYNKDQSTGR